VFKKLPPAPPPPPKKKTHKNKQTNKEKTKAKQNYKIPLLQYQKNAEDLYIKSVAYFTVVELF